MTYHCLLSNTQAITNLAFAIAIGEINIESAFDEHVITFCAIFKSAQ